MNVHSHLRQAGKNREMDSIKIKIYVLLSIFSIYVKKILLKKTMNVLMICMENQGILSILKTVLLPQNS